MTQTIDYTPAPTVAQFIKSEKFYNFIVGPVGSSKTTGILFKILYHAKRQRPSPHDGIRRTRWVIVRNTMPQLRDTTIKSFMTWFQPGIAGQWKSTSNTFVFQFGDVEAEVMFRPLDTPEDVNRVLSLEVTGAVLDEFVEIPKEVVEALSGRCGRYPSKKHDGGPSWWGMWGASNPGNEDDWWYDWLDVEQIGTRPTNMAFYQQPGGFEEGAENLENLPGERDYYTNLVEGKSEEWVAQFVNVRWGFSLRGTPVYKAFRHALHVAQEPIAYNPRLPLVIGFDAGLTPSAILGQQDVTGRMLVLDELISESMGARRFCRDLLIPLLNRRFLDAEVEVVGDPAFSQRAQTDEKTVKEILEQELKVKVRPAPTNALTARIGAVEDFLTRLTDAGPALLIDPRCLTLIRGFSSGYHFAVNRKGHRADSPDKNRYSHPHDANQYLCLAFSQMERATKRRERALGMIKQNQQRVASYNVG